MFRYPLISWLGCICQEFVLHVQVSAHILAPFVGSNLQLLPGAWFVSFLEELFTVLPILQLLDSRLASYPASLPQQQTERDAMLTFRNTHESSWRLVQMLMLGSTSTSVFTLAKVLQPLSISHHLSNFKWYLHFASIDRQLSILIC